MKAQQEFEEYKKWSSEKGFPERSYNAFCHIRRFFEESKAKQDKIDDPNFKSAPRLDSENKFIEFEKELDACVGLSASEASINEMIVTQLYAEEFKKGNHFMVNGDIGVVYSINEQGINLDVSAFYGGNGFIQAVFNNVYINIGNHGFVQPVTLTEDWLNKFGFHWCGMRNGWIIDISKGNIMVIDGRGNFAIGDSCEMDNPVLYVHQLQNLFFALTGKELELKK
jgi:hypothetical protein